MPLIPGIPALPIGVSLPPITILGSQAPSGALWQASQQPPAWGVFDSDGNQVLFPDSVLEFSDSQEYDLPNYPLQDGSFASYNKVIRPFELQFRFSKGGTLDERADFLNSIDDLIASIDVFDVVTPEQVFPSVNFKRKGIARRGPKGAYFLTEIDVYGEQIIQVQAQYSSTGVQLPNATDEAAQPTSNVGNVQAQNPDSQLAQDGQLALQSTPPQFYGGG